MEESLQNGLQGFFIRQCFGRFTVVGLLEEIWLRRISDIEQGSCIASVDLQAHHPFPL